jgi:ABC-type branched-subunit amino acid transport system ATPase component/ABC-type branched-subunit amino acid transport system permease subunit
MAGTPCSVVLAHYDADVEIGNFGRSSDLDVETEGCRVGEGELDAAEDGAMSGGTLVIGLLNGLTIGLLAVGLVLVYKANRFINLAHAQFGALPAVLLAKGVHEWNIPFWVGFPLVVALGAGTALAAERWFVAPVRAQSRSPLRLLLLTVGISQLLLATTYVPWFIPDPGQQRPYPQPFTVSLEVGGVVLSGMDVLTLVLVPSLILGLAGFLRYSSMGKQIRAAANNPDSARLCGVSVRRVSAVTWAAAGGLATVSAVLAAPGQATFQAASLGPQLLLFTLGAAALGAFVSLPVALVGGLVIGMAGQIVTGITSSSSDGLLATFVVILLFIIVRAKPIAKVFAQAGGAVAERSVTRIPAAVRALPVVRHHRALVCTVGLVVALLAPWLPTLTTEAQRFRLVLVLMFCLIGVSLTVLVGWAGQVSMGHGAIVGLGAFVTARLAPEGVTAPILLLLAGLAGAALLVLTGLPAIRVPGFTLAVITLGLAVVGPAWLLRQEWIGTDRPNAVAFDPPLLPSGLGAITDQLGTYYLALAVLVLGLGAASALRRSVPGRLIVATRDNEQAVATYGVAPTSVKLAVLAVSGMLAGAAGGLWAAAHRVANVDQFTPDLSIAVLAIPVVGGLGSLSGAVLGALVLYVPVYFLAPHLEGLLGDFAKSIGFLLILGGAGQVFTIRQFPNGIAGAIQGRWQRRLDRMAQATGEHPADVPVAQEEAAPFVPITPEAPPTLVVRQAERLLRASAAAGDTLPLVAEDIRLRFGGITALDGASIEVRPGEILGLIGPNGAGKSTLLNVVSGVLTADAGSVRLFGTEVGDLSPDLRAAFGVSRTFQHASLFAGLTVTETIQVALSRRWMVRFSAAMLGAPWSRYAEAATLEEARSVLDRFGLTPWADSLCSDLSTGTRRICDLAAQVASQPRLLLLDEPTGGVAQREAEAFGPLLRRIRDELDCSIVIVEHDMPLLMGLCDRVYAMEAGRVIAEGSPEAVRNDPHVIATYLGTDEVAVNRSGTQLTGSNA